MQPYEMEVFNRNIVFKKNFLVEFKDFSFKEDAIDSEQSIILVKHGSGIVKGDYVRFIRENEEYSGVVLMVEEIDHYDRITYTQMITIFDLDIEVNSQAVTQTAMEKYIAQILGAAFINGSDSAQNIPGLAVSYVLSTGHSSTPQLTLEQYQHNILVQNGYSDSDGVWSRSSSDPWDTSGNGPWYWFYMYIDGYIDGEPIYEIEQSPRIGPITINIDSGGTASGGYIGTLDYSNTSSEMTVINILDDLIYPAFGSHAVYTRAYLNAAAKRINVDIGINQNAAITIEADHPNILEKNIAIRKTKKEVNKVIIKNTDTGQVYTYYLHPDGTYDQTNSNRITPVNVKYAYVSSASAAASSVKGKYQNYVDTMGAFLEVSRRLTNSEYQALAEAAAVLCPVYLDNYGFPTPSKPPEIVNNGTWSNYDYEIKYECGRLLDPEKYYLDYKDSNSHVHLTARYLNNGSNGFETTAAVDFTSSMARQAWSYIQTTGSYSSEISQMSSNIAAILVTNEVSKIFMKQARENLIELTVRIDDERIQPLSMQIGQEVNIIHDGVSYNSILTGREIGNGLVKLIFGTIRLELTKYLKGRY